MNRANRRKMMKKARSSGISKGAVMAYLAANDAGIELGDRKIKYGDKVRLDVERIRSRDDYQQMIAEYKSFVESNADKVFTAKPEGNTMTSFEEDDTWLFWNGDLIIEENITETL